LSNDLEMNKTLEQQKIIGSSVGLKWFQIHFLIINNNWIFRSLYAYEKDNKVAFLHWMSYLSLLYLSIYFLKAFFKEIKMLLFHIFNTEIIDRSIVSYYLTANVTLFRGILMPCSDGINILHLFGTLGLCRLLAKTLEIFQKFQNFKNFKNFSFH
jgi:hypothetical protein